MRRFRAIGGAGGNGGPDIVRRSAATLALLPRLGRALQNKRAELGINGLLRGSLSHGACRTGHAL